MRKLRVNRFPFGFPRDKFVSISVLFRQMRYTCSIYSNTYRWNSIVNQIAVYKAINHLMRSFDNSMQSIIETKKKHHQYLVVILLSFSFRKCTCHIFPQFNTNWIESVFDVSKSSQLSAFGCGKLSKCTATATAPPHCHQVNVYDRIKSSYGSGSPHVHIAWRLRMKNNAYAY